MGEGLTGRLILQLSIPKVLAFGKHFVVKTGMGKRERGTGSLLKMRGCRYWYAQFYDVNGKQRRVSTRTEIKMEAQCVLRNLLTDKSRGLQFERKIQYSELRAALLQNYRERGNKSLFVMSDGEGDHLGSKAGWTTISTAGRLPRLRPTQRGILRRSSWPRVAPTAP